MAKGKSPKTKVRECIRLVLTEQFKSDLEETTFGWKLKHYKAIENQWKSEGNKGSIEDVFPDWKSTADKKRTWRADQVRAAKEKAGLKKKRYSAEAHAEKRKEVRD